MFKVHGYLDGKRVINWRMEHLPRTGDTMRFAGEKYAKVTEVIWCMDEGSDEWQRVNVRMETETPNAQGQWTGAALCARSTAPQGCASGGDER